MSKNAITQPLIIMVALGVFVVGVGWFYWQPAGAQRSYQVVAWTIDYGGATVEDSQSSGYELWSTVGQPESVGAVRQSQYDLQNGFWGAQGERFIYMPIVYSNFFRKPDLIGSISITPPGPTYDFEERVAVTVVVTNVGEAEAGPFWVDFYINPARVPAVNERWNDLCTLSPCYGIAWVVPALGVGQSTSLTSLGEEANVPGGYCAPQTLWSNRFEPGTNYFYVLVDSWDVDSPIGAVAESKEDNNRTRFGNVTVSEFDNVAINPLQLEERVLFCPEDVDVE